MKAAIFPHPSPLVSMVLVSVITCIPHPIFPSLTVWTMHSWRFNPRLPYITLSHGESSSLFSFIFSFGKEGLSSFLLLFLVFKYEVIFYYFYSYYLDYEHRVLYTT